MAGHSKRMFELDTAVEASESLIGLEQSDSTPNLRVTQSVKDAVQRLRAGTFRAVNFLAGKQNLHFFAHHLILLHHTHSAEWSLLR
jgi:hypothetical protein